MMEAVKGLWADMNAQNWAALAGYFTPDASIRWPNTREEFTPAEFVRVNSEFPGDWGIEVRRLDACGRDAVSVVQVRLLPQGPSFHAVSFFVFDETGKITELVEYWGDDGEPPQWRTEKQIGKRYD